MTLMKCVIALVLGVACGAIVVLNWWLFKLAVCHVAVCR